MSARRLLPVICAFALISAAADAQTEPASPIDRPLPDYPANITTPGLTGSVKLRYDIAVDGTVSQADVIESQPASIFDAAAIAAVKQWKFKPRTTNGVASEQGSNVIVLRFQPPEGPTAELMFRPEAIYPEAALNAKKSGWVKVQFDVGPDGRTAHEHVIEHSPDGTFDGSALSSIHHAFFRPPAESGQQSGVSGLTYTIDFQPDHAFLEAKLLHIGHPFLPMAATRNNVREGFLDMKLHLTKDGKVDSVLVLRSDPQGIFEPSAIQVMKSGWFEPPHGPPCPCISADQVYSLRYHW